VKYCVRAPSFALVLMGSLLGADPSNLGVASAWADEAETANACVGFQNDYGDKQITVHASNSCERRLACTLDYTVRCEDNGGKVTSGAAKRALFALASKGRADISLSAAHCKQGWAIDDPAWSCR
jgi:hypothetical protein